MKVKALRYKDSKEFVEIITMNEIHMIFTSTHPRIMTKDSNIKILEKYYNKPEFNKIDFSKFELVEYDLIESGEVGADIRNKLSSQKNLVCLLEKYFDKKNKIDKEKLLEYIKKEMKQTKINIDYIADLL